MNQSDTKNKIDYCEQMISILERELKLKTFDLAKMRARIASGESVDFTDYDVVVGEIENLGRRLKEYAATLKNLSSNFDFDPLYGSDFFVQLNKRCEFNNVRLPESSKPLDPIIIEASVRNIGMEDFNGANQLSVSLSNEDMNYHEEYTIDVNLFTEPRLSDDISIEIEGPSSEGIYDLKMFMKDSQLNYSYPYTGIIIVVN